MLKVAFIMGNTGVKDRSQQLSLDDAGPTLLHGHGFFGRTATEDSESSPGRVQYIFFSDNNKAKPTKTI